MIPIFSQNEFDLAKSKDLLKCQCIHCNEIFTKTKHEIQRALNPNNSTTNKFCSRECYKQNKNLKQNVICLYCGNEFMKESNKIKRSPKHFCTRSCAASYRNKNKIAGNRRSKLEKWLEEQLNFYYPNLLIEYNQKTAIQSELDIYIPKLNIAFELNGIFHYEPIFGVDKLNQIKTNDNNKFQLCIEAKIDLCVIDTSKQKYFKVSTSQKYLDIITKIINERLLTS